MNIKITSINKEKLKKIGKTVLCTTLIGSIIFFTSCGKTNSDYISNVNENSIVDYEDGSYYLGPVATNDDLKGLPGYVTELEIMGSGFITDLSNLSTYLSAENIEILRILDCPGITDLSIIYEMPNLKEIYLHQCVGVTQELVDYLNSKGIVHNITQQDIKNSQTVDNILAEIIKPGMSDREKIKAISLYVAKNYSYSTALGEESNEEPLTCFFENKKGVCMSYAYLTQVLLTKAGVTSYELRGDKQHAWNLVEVDDKYYYLDVTNIKQAFGLTLLGIELFDAGYFYMIDPSAAGLSVMTKYNAGPSKIVIPKTLVEEIEKSENGKNFYEKYGNSRLAYDLQILIAIAGIGMGIKGITSLKDSLSYKKSNKGRRR